MDVHSGQAKVVLPVDDWANNDIHKREGVARKVGVSTECLIQLQEQVARCVRVCSDLLH